MKLKRCFTLLTLACLVLTSVYPTSVLAAPAANVIPDVSGTNGASNGMVGMTPQESRVIEDQQLSPDRITVLADAWQNPKTYAAGTLLWGEGAHSTKWQWNKAERTLSICLGQTQLEGEYTEGTPWQGSTEIERLILAEGFRDTSGIPQSLGQTLPALTQVRLPGTLRTINANAFRGAAITSAVVPEGVTTIGENAFQDCHQLLSVSLPRSLTLIESHAFERSGLEAVHLPDGIYIEAYAFNDCAALMSVVFEGAFEYEGYAFSSSNVTGLLMPDGFEYLWFRSAPGFEKLRSLELPACLTYFEINLTDFPELRDIYFLGTREQWQSMDCTVPQTEWTDRGINIHFGCSSGAPSWKPGEQATTWSIGRLIGFKEETGEITLDGLNLNRYTIAPGADGRGLLPDLMKQYICMETEKQGEDFFAPITVLAVYPVEARLGHISHVATNSVTLDGRSWPTASTATFGGPCDMDVICWIHDGIVISYSTLDTVEGVVSSVTGSGNNLVVNMECGKYHLSYDVTGVTDASTRRRLRDFVDFNVTAQTHDGLLLSASVPSSVTFSVKRQQAGRDLAPGDQLAVTAEIVVGSESSSAGFTFRSSDSSVLTDADRGSAFHGVLDGSPPLRAVRVYTASVLKAGKASIECRLDDGTTKSLAYEILTDEQKRLMERAENLNAQFHSYMEELQNAISSKADVPVPDSKKLGADLEARLDEFGIIITNPLNAQVRPAVCRALLEVLTDEVSYQLGQKEYHMSDLTSVPMEIVKDTANGIRVSDPVCHLDSKTKVTFHLLNAYGACTGQAVYEQRGSGSQPSVYEQVGISTNQKKIEKIVKAYSDQMLTAAKSAQIYAYQEVKKELENALSKSGLATLGTEKIQKILADKAELLTSLGFGDAVGFIRDIAEFHDDLSILAAAATASSPDAVLQSMKKIRFDNKGVSDKAAKRIVNSVSAAASEFITALEDYLATGTSGFDPAYLAKRICKALIQCPVDIEIYNAEGTLIGSIGDSLDTWHDASVHVEEYGESKIVWAGDGMKLKITGTDEGSMTCVFEEYEEGRPVQRTNYYDIDLSHGQEFTVQMADEVHGEVELSNSGKTVSPDEVIAVAAYPEQTSEVVCMSSEGGTVAGSGSYRKGDTAILTAEPTDGYLFSHWTDENGLTVSHAKRWQFTVTKPITVTPMFVLAEGTPAGEPVYPANLLEAYLTLQLLDENGSEIATGSTLQAGDLVTAVISAQNIADTSVSCLVKLNGLTGRNGVAAKTNLSFTENGSVALPLLVAPDARDLLVQIYNIDPAETPCTPISWTASASEDPGEDPPLASTGPSAQPAPNLAAVPGYQAGWFGNKTSYVRISGSSNMFYLRNSADKMERVAVPYVKDSTGKRWYPLNHGGNALFPRLEENRVTCYCIFKGGMEVPVVGVTGAATPVITDGYQTGTVGKSTYYVKVSGSSMMFYLRNRSGQMERVAVPYVKDSTGKRWYPVNHGGTALFPVLKNGEIASYATGSREAVLVAV